MNGIESRFSKAISVMNGSDPTIDADTLYQLCQRYPIIGRMREESVIAFDYVDYLESVVVKELGCEQFAATLTRDDVEELAEFFTELSKYM